MDIKAVKLLVIGMPKLTHLWLCTIKFKEGNANIDALGVKEIVAGLPDLIQLYIGKVFR